jgi:threonine/homoserine/homoserine lactone efflux protein
VFTAVGVVLGQAIWALATAAGLAAPLAASEPSFVAVRLVGAAYLVFLGAQALVAAFRGAGAGPRHRPLARAHQQPDQPQDGRVLPELAPAVHRGQVWLTAYAVAVARAGDALSQPRVRRVLEGVTGACLVGLGLRLAAER